jgi:hypothetical protein
MSNGASAAASAFPLSSGQSLGARTKSPATNSSTSIEGWLQNVPPPTSNAVPVLPAKPQSNSNELADAWSVKPADPWKQQPSQQQQQQQQQQVPDPWNSKTSNEPLDPWAPLGDLHASGVSHAYHMVVVSFAILKQTYSFLILVSGTLIIWSSPNK